MQLGRPLQPLVLTVDERTTLETWARRQTTVQALRARIVMQAADGESNTKIARRERVTAATVRKWRSRFLRKGLAALRDEPRRRVPRTITDADVDIVSTSE